MKLANGLEDVGLVHLILQLGRRTGAKISSKPFKYACNSGNCEYAKLFINHIDLHSGTKNNVPLDVASRSRDLDLIAAALDAGAHIDLRAYKGVKSNSKGSREYKTPVEVAMHYGTPTLKPVLERGAEIPHLSRWVTDRRAYNCLRKAAFSRNEKTSHAPVEEFWDMTNEELAIY